MCLIVLVLFLCLILPGNRLQVENTLLSCYIAAKMAVNSANAYSPRTVSNSQLRMVHSSTSAIPPLACKSGPLLGFREVAGAQWSGSVTTFKGKES